jgi:hypothetical protein
MKLARLLLLAVILGLAACTAAQKTPPEECHGRPTEQEPDGGLGGTGHTECYDPDRDGRTAGE